VGTVSPFSGGRWKGIKDLVLKHSASPLPLLEGVRGRGIKRWRNFL